MKKLILFLSLIIGAETALPCGNLLDITFDKTKIVVDDKTINNNAEIASAVARYTNALALNKETNVKCKKVLIAGTIGIIATETLHSLVHIVKDCININN